MELKVVCENASELARSDQTAFAMLRRQGFGASDSSILLGVNPFPDNTIDDLIKQKQSKFLTANELAIGQMVNVRKGADLEPIILKKFEDKYNREVSKPEAMYRIGDTPLTVNFDGVMDVSGYKIPVECKFVSTYGSKYYTLNKVQGAELDYSTTLKDFGVDVNRDYLLLRADECGIPIYYYTQIQQQLLALNAPFGYLAALFDKDWELRTFKVVADKQVQNKLLEVATALWQEIESSK